MNSSNPIATVLLVALTVASSFGSLPHIPESSHAISDNGRYRLDCIAERGTDPVFKLTDIQNERVLWKQTKKWIEEAQAIYVHDDGNSVIEDLENHLVFTDRKGKITGEVNIPNDAFTPEEIKSYVEDSTAGPMWGHSVSISYFLQVKNELLFVMRPWWGRRLIVNFDEGKLISSSGTILAGCVAHEKKLALKKIELALKDPNVREGDFSSSLFATTLMAGQLQFPETVPLIEKLQDLTDGYDDSGKVVDLTLRRLGKKPKRGESREQKMKHLEVGMGRKEVLQQMHVPDFGSEVQWEYDIDAKQPFTLVLKWDKNRTKVAAIEKTKKPLWSKGDLRDRQVVDGIFPELSFGELQFLEELADDAEESK